MSYKTILVHLDDRPRRAERLALAFALAARFDAHLVGLFALEATRIPSYALAEAGPLVEEIQARSRSWRSPPAATTARLPPPTSRCDGRLRLLAAARRAPCSRR